MDESMGARYWCHMCHQMVNPVVEVEIKCPFCQSGFIEEMGSPTTTTTTTTAAATRDNSLDPESDRALSLWAPILLGMMGNPRNQRRFSRRRDFDEDDDDDNDEVEDESHHVRGDRGETELDRELQSIIRRRRRSSATILQLLQSIRAGMALDTENSPENDRDSDRQRERVVLINPFNRSVIVQGSYDRNQNRGLVGSLGDYFVGPSLDMLLQHLAENDPNRYGTLPAQKEAVEAMPTVKVEDNLQCSICLDDFEIGNEAKEMPCKHKFHNGCIVPWLELHSSCPVCRYQVPADESKLVADGPRSNIDSMVSTNNNGTNGNNNANGEDEEGDDRNGRRFSIPWPFAGFFSSTSGRNSTSTSSADNVNGNASQTDEN